MYRYSLGLLLKIRLAVVKDTLIFSSLKTTFTEGKINLCVAEASQRLKTFNHTNACPPRRRNARITHSLSLAVLFYITWVCVVFLKPLGYPCRPDPPIGNIALSRMHKSYILILRVSKPADDIFCCLIND